MHTLVNNLLQNQYLKKSIQKVNSQVKGNPLKFVFNFLTYDGCKSRD